MGRLGYGLYTSFSNLALIQHRNSSERIENIFETAKHCRNNGALKTALSLVMLIIVAEYKGLKRKYSVHIGNEERIKRLFIITDTFMCPWYS